MKLMLKENRKKAKMTQAQLAEKIGVDIKTVGNWERGVTAMNVEQVWDCAVALGCTPNDLCGWYVEHPDDASPDLSPDEAELLGNYRGSAPRWKSNLSMTARAAAGDSNDETQSHDLP